MNAIVGDWGDVFNTSIIGIHQVMLEDGRVLFWGGDGNGNAFSNTQKYGIFDPATGEHEILDAGHAVRMFCGAGVILPGTDKVLITGGNGTGAPGGQLFDLSDESLVRDGANDMSSGRFYPTTVSLSSGQAVVLGGNGSGNGIPEIFTLGEGWRQLDGATDPDVSSSWWYPRAWVGNTGEVIYIAINSGNQNANAGAVGTFEVMAMDPSGSGSVRQIGELPFQMDATSPSAMYDVGKIAIMDHTGDLWIMDINGDQPTYTLAADLDGDRNNSDMTVLPDGRLLINGGTKVGNSQSESDAVFESVIFDPYTGEVSVVDSEDVMRLYHSSSILLNDGTVMSMGGGGLNNTVDMMDAQIYTPDYLFNDDGTPADRPEIVSAPDSVQPGETLIITLDDTASIARMSFVKTGAVTHSLNMESGRMDLEFTVLDDQRIEVSLPDNPNILAAGNWMLFAIDDDGVPSVAPIISVEPTLPIYETPDNNVDPFVGQISVEYFDADVSNLDQVDFSGDPIFEEDVTKIQENAGTGSFYDGGPTDRFAAQYSGQFSVTVAGQYTFYLNSDDGSRLSIDGNEIIANDGLHAPIEVSTTIYLEAGVHTLGAQYFEQGGGAVMELDWKGPGFIRTDFEVNGTPPVNGNETNDVPNETQYLTGTPETDIFVINGNSSDYGWGPTLDGTGIVVWGPTGHDLLTDFEEIRFNDTSVSLVPEGNVYTDNPNATQFITGTSAEETFLIAGNSTDYNWGATQDGLGFVVWNDTGHDILYDIEKIQFTDRTVDLGGTGGGGNRFDDDPNQTQYLTGTTETDTFVVDGTMADYQWGVTQDGDGFVVWNDTGHDILYDIEEIEFNDQTITLDTVGA